MGTQRGSPLLAGKTHGFMAPKNLILPVLTYKDEVNQSTYVPLY